ncbi:MAG: HNH endonuclease [Deltaproteobacteria bacterium]|nr:HNH endonuclease [Deltaproteobacteria bacterium]
MTEWHERFWEKVDQSGDCWVWTAATDKDGYGIFQLEGKAQKAHRVIFLVLNGKLPPKEKKSCHSCDNPPCVNPEHLWLGSTKDNIHDALSKRRLFHQKGDHPKKLAAAIAAYKAGKNTIGEIVERFGVSSSTLNVHTKEIPRRSLKVVITDKQVREIRAAATRGEAHKVIADRYDIYISTVGKICRREVRSNVK